MHRTQQVYLAAVGLTIALIWMDALDGYVARKRQECTKFGAVADILGDRVTVFLCLIRGAPVLLEARRLV
ncbi:MAG TPA: CDP-alcohol phosphatidyltransferase family protein [Gemmatimonadaceae bacterium]|nr:CDP-alcohol phosphatidyltransferase family protein [Gemmatimonadaceae bacterium]